MGRNRGASPCAEKESRSKKAFMVQFWRMQQSQAFVNSFFFATTLAILLMPYLGPYVTGVTRNAFITFALLFGLVMGLVLAFGYAFDVVWKLWKQQVVVGTERNPYALEKLTAKEVVIWRMLHLPTLRALGKQRQAAVMEGWLEASLSADPRLAADVEVLEGWLGGLTPVNPVGPGVPMEVLPGGAMADVPPPSFEVASRGPMVPYRK
jgi:hypothetical protein